MKQLSDFINEYKLNENKLQDQYGVFLASANIVSSVRGTVKDGDIESKDLLASTIEEAIKEATSKYKVLRIKAVEEFTEKKKKRIEDRDRKAIEDAEKRFYELMKTKPGIMRRSEKLRQEWIDGKMKEFKRDYKEYYKKHPDYFPALEYDEKNVEIDFHDDYLKPDSFTSLNMKFLDVQAVSKHIADAIGTEYPWTHLKAINIAVSWDALHSWAPTFHVYPMFDEETTKQIEKESTEFNKNLADYMSRMYDQGSYSGD